MSGWFRRVGGRSGRDQMAPSAPGRIALDDHINAADGGPETDRIRPRPRRRRPPPLDEITLHRIPDPPHWHLVTYGLSDLERSDASGAEPFSWGFELTFRVEEDGPPRWAADLLTSLAAYVWSSGHPFASGHNVDLRGPIRLDSPTRITAAMIVEDPVLGRLEGPFGPIQFLQVVGLTAGELELCRAWTTDGVRELLARSDPLLVTRLERTGVDEDPGWAEEISRRRAEEGSSLHELRVGSLQVYDQRGRGTVVELGAGAASALGPALTRELLAVGAGFSVIGDEYELRFVTSEAARWSGAGASIEIAVPLPSVEELAAFFDGSTGWRQASDWPGLTFRIVD